MCPATVPLGAAHRPDGLQRHPGERGPRDRGPAGGPAALPPEQAVTRLPLPCPLGGAGGWGARSRLCKVDRASLDRPAAAPAQARWDEEQDQAAVPSPRWPLSHGAEHGPFGLRIHNTLPMSCSPSQVTGLLGIFNKELVGHLSSLWGGWAARESDGKAPMIPDCTSRGSPGTGPRLGPPWSWWVGCAGALAPHTQVPELTPAKHILTHHLQGNRQPTGLTCNSSREHKSPKAQSGLEHMMTQGAHHRHAGQCRCQRSAWASALRPLSPHRCSSGGHPEPQPPLLSLLPSR